jgi:NAD(P)-dependent dehydrogenase (short-subunit alcohol dehydrogenase family)
MSSNPTYTEETSGIEVAAAYSAQASGKTILITGVSNGGIGEATARAFAHGGAHIIIITGRNEERLYAVYKTLSSDYPETKFRTFRLDLDSLAAVRQSALEILNDASVEKIDIIIINAGFSAFTGDRALTVDGYERHFGVNHLAHFLFVTKLLSKLRLAAEKTKTHGQTRIIACE